MSQGSISHDNFCQDGCFFIFNGILYKKLIFLLPKLWNLSLISTSWCAYMDKIIFWCMFCAFNVQYAWLILGALNVIYLVYEMILKYLLSLCIIDSLWLRNDLALTSETLDKKHCWSPIKPRMRTQVVQFCLCRIHTKMSKTEMQEVNLETRKDGRFLNNNFFNT